MIKEKSSASSNHAIACRRRLISQALFNIKLAFDKSRTIRGKYQCKIENNLIKDKKIPTGNFVI